MHLLNTCLACSLTLLLATLGCGDHNGNRDGRPNANAPYIVQETLARGDTGITKLAGFKRVNELDILCQHWEIGDASDASTSLQFDKEDNRVFPGLNLFTDSSYVANPRGDISTGTWSIKKAGKEMTLVLMAADKKETTWHINELNSRSLRLTTTDETGSSLYLNLSSDGIIHKNRLNDPFHPVNNQWRIPPVKPENDSAIAVRARQCLQFYALFYRDNILRQQEKINFAGLPPIFEWYSRGIGMPDWDDIHDSWVRCFYDKDQARKGYNVLRKLIVDYEFNWVKGLPDWRMETENVLEQMWHKM